MTLSIQTIESALPGETVRDTVVPGLHLRVFDLRRSFYLYYTTKQGRERRPKIGDHPTISLTAARRIAKDMLTVVAAGGDPSAERQADRVAPTVKELCDQYTEKHGDKKKPKPASEDRRMIRDVIVPELGKMKAADVTTEDIEKLHEARKATPYAANRILALLSKMFSLAENKWKMRPKGSNPCKGIARFREYKRRRYLSREEAVAIVGRLRHYEAARPQAVAFIWLLIYTGARPAEIAALEPQHRRGALLTLEEHKTDAKTSDVRTIHLPPQAVEILDRLPTPNHGTLLGIKSPRRLWSEILEDTGIEHLRIYDVRHSFASLGLSNGLSLPQIGELLGHKSPLTTSRYAHLIDEAAQGAAAATANAFDAFSKPAPKAKASKPKVVKARLRVRSLCEA